MDVVDRLAEIECGTERADAVREFLPNRDSAVAVLLRYGFGGPNQAVPTDWATYYDLDELQGFVLEYAETERPSA